MEGYTICWYLCYLFKNSVAEKLGYLIFSNPVGD